MGRLQTGLTRKQIKQTLNNYVKAINLNDGEGRPDPSPSDIQGILESFKRKIKNVEAVNIPALAISLLPVKSNRIMISFDEDGRDKRHDDTDILIILGTRKSSISWYHVLIKL